MLCKSVNESINISAARQQASELEMSTKDLRLKTMAALEGKEEQIAEALSNVGKELFLVVIEYVSQFL